MFQNPSSHRQPLAPEAEQLHFQGIIPPRAPRAASVLAAASFDNHPCTATVYAAYSPGPPGIQALEPSPSSGWPARGQRLGKPGARRRATCGRRPAAARMHGRHQIGLRRLESCRAAARGRRIRLCISILPSPSLPPSIHPSFLPSIHLSLSHSLRPTAPTRPEVSRGGRCHVSRRPTQMPGEASRAGSGPAVRSKRAGSRMGSNPAGAARDARAGLARRRGTIERPAQPVAAGAAERRRHAHPPCPSSEPAVTRTAVLQLLLPPPRVFCRPAAAPHGVARRGALCRNAAAALFSSVLRDLPGRSRPGSW